MMPVQTCPGCWLAFIAMVSTCAALPLSGGRGIVFRYKECSYSRNQECPERHYCVGNEGWCFPCSACGEGAACMEMHGSCDSFKPFNYASQLNEWQSRWTPSCPVAELLSASTTADGDDDQVAIDGGAGLGVTVACEPGCDRLQSGSARCFPGTTCNVTCLASKSSPQIEAAAPQWIATCNCNYANSTATCSWSQRPVMCSRIPLPDKPTTTATSRAAADEAETSATWWRADMLRVIAVSTSGEIVTGQSEAAATSPSYATYIVPMIIVCAAVFGVLACMVKRRRCQPKTPGVAGYDPVAGCSNLPNDVNSTSSPGDPRGASPVLPCSLPPVQSIVYNVTNVNNCTMHINNGVMDQSSCQQEDGFPCFNEATLPGIGELGVLSTNGHIPGDDECTDGSGSDAENGCRQPLLSTGSLPSGGGRHFQASGSASQQEQQPHVCDEDASDVIQSQAYSSGRSSGRGYCSDPATAKVSAAAGYSPKTEPLPPESFADTCTHKPDSCRDPDVLQVEGHSGCAAGTDNDNGSECAAAVKPEVLKSAVCGAGSGASDLIGALSHVQKSTGLVSLTATCAMKLEVLSVANAAHHPSPAAWAADGGPGGGAIIASGAVGQESGNSHMFRVSASLESHD